MAYTVTREVADAPEPGESGVIYEYVIKDANGVPIARTYDKDFADFVKQNAKPPKEDAGQHFESHELTVLLASMDAARANCEPGHIMSTWFEKTYAKLSKKVKANRKAEAVSEGGA